MFRKILAVALGAVLSSGAAMAQTYPSRNITMIIPYAAGGPTDTVGRLIAEAMGRDLGQTIVIENVNGAGGTLGSARVATAAPDGYTILLHHFGLASADTLYRRLPYKTLEAFEYVGLVTDAPMTLIARANFPATDLKALVDYVKANKERVTMANAGLGSASHLCGMLFQSAIGTQVTTVPYTGTGPAMTDILAGQVDIMCDQTTNTMTQIQGNRVKAYAITTPQRLSLLPNLPTGTEAGLPNFQVAVWHGVYAPKGTPAAVVNRLNAALKVALKDRTVIERFAALGTAPSPESDASPAALKAKLEGDVPRLGALIKAAGQYAD
jgi:tripartite-type tricarboxylate transporter receptor subunit TctC